MNKTFVWLAIWSKELTADQITEAVGIACDKSWKIGETRARTIIVEEDNGWVIDSTLPKQSSLYAHIENVLDRLTPVADRIRRLSEECEVELGCAIYSETEPGLHFSKDVVRRIAQMGAGFDVDLYVLGEEANSNRSN